MQSRVVSINFGITFSEILGLKSEGFDMKVNLKYLASLWKLDLTGSLENSLCLPVQASAYRGLNHHLILSITSEPSEPLSWN